MKVVCTHSKKQYSTNIFYFKENKIYEVYINKETDRRVIRDEFGMEWFYNYISLNFIPLSKERKNKLLKIKKYSLSLPD
jgi:hypothetical protein